MCELGTNSKEKIVQINLFHLILVHAKFHLNWFIKKSLLEPKLGEPDKGEPF